MWPVELLSLTARAKVMGPTKTGTKNTHCTMTQTVSHHSETAAWMLLMHSYCHKIEIKRR